MTFVAKARVRETSTTTGTGALTLAGAVQDYRRFSDVMSVGDTCWYLINLPGSASWEVGVGTYSGVNTLTRTTVLESTNANAAVSFAAGVKDVILVFPGSLASHNINQIEESIASAGTTDLGSLGTKRINITGSATVTSFGTSPNQLKFIRVTGGSPDVGVTFTNNSTSLICPAETSFTMFNGDRALVQSDASGNWRFLHVTRHRSAAGSDFQPGVSSLFFQAAAPIFWTKQTTHNDKAIRIVSGTGGGAAGSTAFTSVFAARTIARNNLPNVNFMSDGAGNLPLASSGHFGGSASGSYAAGGVAAAGGTVSQITVNMSGNIYLNGNTGQQNMDFAVQYIDTINCTKDA